MDMTKASMRLAQASCLPWACLGRPRRIQHVRVRVWNGCAGNAKETMLPAHCAAGSGLLDWAQKGAHTSPKDSDGEATVLVKGVKTERNIMVRRSNACVASGSRDVVAFGSGGGRENVGGMAGCGYPAFGEDSGRKRARTSEGDADFLTRTPPSQQAARSAGRRLTADALQSHCLRAGGPIDVGSVAGSVVNERVAKPPSKQVLMLQARSKLQSDVKGFLQEMTATKSTYMLLKRRAATTDAGVLAKTELKADAVLGATESGLIRPLEALDSEMKDLPLGEVDAKRVALTPHPTAPPFPISCHVPSRNPFPSRM